MKKTGRLDIFFDKGHWKNILGCVIDINDISDDFIFPFWEDGYGDELQEKYIMVTSFDVRNVLTQEEFDQTFKGREISPLAEKLMAKRGISTS